MDDHKEKFCPLCANEMDWTDKQFKPCPCGYQICIWCWHHIMEEIEGHPKARCPACTVPYNKDKIPSAAIDTKSAAEINLKKKQKAKKENQNVPEDRSHLSDCRLIRHDVVFLTGIPVSLANEKTLQKNQFLGQYGKVLKAIPLRDLSNKQDSSSSSVCGIYVTFLREEDALRCILSVNGFILNGNPLRACYGTSKYCQSWLQNMPCRNRDCVYSHDKGRKEDICSKDDVVSACLSKVQECSGISLNSLPRRQGSCFPPPIDLSKVKNLNKDLSKAVNVPVTSINSPQTTEDNCNSISDSRSCGSRGVSSTSRQSNSVTPVTFANDSQSNKENKDSISDFVPCVSRATPGTSRLSNSVVSRRNLSSCPMFSTTLRNQLPLSNNIMVDTSYLGPNDKNMIESTSTSAHISIKKLNEDDTNITNYVGKYTLFSNDDAMMETRKILQTLSNNSSSIPSDIVQDKHETSLAASCSIHCGPNVPIFGYGSLSIDQTDGNLMENWQNLQTSPDPALFEHGNLIGTSYPVNFAPVEYRSDGPVGISSSFHSARTFAPPSAYSYSLGLDGISLDTGLLLETNQDRTLFLQETRHFDFRINSLDSYSEHFEDLTDMYCQNSCLGYNLLSSLELVSSSDKIGSNTLDTLDFKGMQLSETSYGIQSSSGRNKFDHAESFSGMLEDAISEDVLADEVILSCGDLSVKQHLGELVLPSHERKDSWKHIYSDESTTSFSVMNSVSGATELLSSTKTNCSWKNKKDNPINQLDTGRESRIHWSVVQKDSTLTGLQNLEVKCNDQGDVSCSNAAKDSCCLQNLQLSAPVPRPSKASNLSTPPGFTVPTVRLATQGFPNRTVVGE